MNLHELPSIRIFKKGWVPGWFSEHLGLTIRACLLIASGGKCKRYLCFVSIAATRKSLDGIQLKETEPLSPPTEVRGGDKEEKRGCCFKRLLGIRETGILSDKRSQLRYHWEDDSDVKSDSKVGQQQEGPLGPFPSHATSSKARRTWHWAEGTQNLQERPREIPKHTWDLFQCPQNFLPVT